ncbi:MAG TPA: 1-(5-phosphoribosyl)-5-[(5-phosphoribosylamino)methylideneamino]imidazole-4-carboxamide isomerase [Limnochordia bacterium]
MDVIPAIDLKDGRCVRLLRGDPAAVTVYGDDPVTIARRWESLGARLVHVVDLDGAFSGAPRNRDRIAAIAAALGTPVQLGGGLRTLEAIEAAFEAGVARAVLGTAAVEQPQLVRDACRRWPGRILVGVDARDGVVAVRGWTAGSGVAVPELLAAVQQWGVREVIFTDIGRDGTLGGPNLEALRGALASGVDVIASGGVASLDDIVRLAELAHAVKDLPGFGRLVGVIVGKALYAGTLELPAALAAAGASRKR